MKILNMVVAAAMVLPGTALIGETLSQHEVIVTVLRNNPRLRAARAGWEMLRQRVPQAKAWDDPTAGVDVERHGTTRFDTYSDNEWMVSQAIPVSGKNLARGRAATAEALSGFEELRRVELDVVSQARAALARLAGAYQELEINQRNRELLGQLTEISRAKYESGTRSQADLLTAQTELVRLTETQAQFEQAVSDAQTQLNVLMNRPAGTSLARPASLAFTPLAWSKTRIEEFALAHRPELAKAQRAIEAEKARIQLAKRQWIPDPQFRVEVRQFKATGGIQEYDTGIFFQVPWMNYRKYSAGVAEAGKALEAAQSQYEAARTEVIGLVRDQLTRIETTANNYRLFQDRISPLARQTVETIRSSYESDQTSFLELATARRTLQDAESAQLQHLVDHEIAIAELDAVIGRTTLNDRGGESK